MKSTTIKKRSLPTGRGTTVLTNKARNEATGRAPMNGRFEPRKVSLSKSTPTIRSIAPDRLRPHPVQLEIYGDQPGAELVESIREHGVLAPLLATPQNVILSGHLRHAASGQASLSEVPVITVNPVDEDAAIDLLLAANSQRVKTNEQIAREAAFRMKIEAGKARVRQASGAAEKVPAKSPEATGDARTIVAKQMNIGAKKVDQCVAIVEALDQLDASGDTVACAKVTQALAKSVNKAYQKVIVMSARARHGVRPSAPAVETCAPAVDRAAIIARIQDDLAEGMETWSVESLLAFEKVFPAFKADWFTAHGKEVA